LSEEMYECDWRVGHLAVDQRKHGRKFFVIILELRDLIWRLPSNGKG